MTYEEKVKQIYPEGVFEQVGHYQYYFKSKPLPKDYALYYIIISTTDDKWEQVWKRIEAEMLKRLTI